MGADIKLHYTHFRDPASVWFIDVLSTKVNKPYEGVLLPCGWLGCITEKLLLLLSYGLSAAFLELELLYASSFKEKTTIMNLHKLDLTNAYRFALINRALDVKG